MVSIPEEPEPQRETTTPGWWLTGVFVIAAMLGLWWADLQQQSIREWMGSTFQVPAGRWILWSLTLIVVGLCVGLAVAAASDWRGRISVAGLVWVVIPLTPIVLLHFWFAGGLSFGSTLSQVMTSLATQVACALTVGVFLAGLLAPLLPTNSNAADSPTNVGDIDVSD